LRIHWVLVYFFYLSRARCFHDFDSVGQDEWVGLLRCYHRFLGAPSYTQESPDLRIVTA